MVNEQEANEYLTEEEAIEIFSSTNPSEEICWACDGTGSGYRSATTCKTCKGSGKLKKKHKSKSK